jgi:hypothetical protein
MVGGEPGALARLNPSTLLRQARETPFLHRNALTRGHGTNLPLLRASSSAKMPSRFRAQVRSHIEELKSRRSFRFCRQVALAEKTALHVEF